MHNVHYLLSLMGSIRAAILEDRYPAFIRDFFNRLYGNASEIPSWVVNALHSVGVDLLAE
jgi:queuine tRNA-ribosyltransferase catalytic subunit